ncbi:hypothetical protein Ccrd_012224, partial [Cynara cardunculus var. scolymus]
MAIQHEITRQTQTKILDTAPFMVLLLIAAHVFALVYGIYKLATSKLPQRRIETIKKRINRNEDVRMDRNMITDVKENVRERASARAKTIKNVTPSLFTCKVAKVVHIFFTLWIEQPEKDNKKELDSAAEEPVYYAYNNWRYEECCHCV